MGNPNQGGGSLPHVEGIGRRNREASLAAIDAMDRGLDESVLGILSVLGNRSPELINAPPVVDQQSQGSYAQVESSPVPAPAAVTEDTGDAFQGIADSYYTQTATNAPAVEMTASTEAGPYVQTPVPAAGGEQFGSVIANEPQATYQDGKTMDQLLADVEQAREIDELESV